MGATFSSSRLSGAVSNGVPSISYAYSTANTASFGVDATYHYDNSGAPQFTTPVGAITPYLKGGGLTATVTCTPFAVEASGQSLECPIAATALSPALYTVSFSQYTSISSGQFIVRAPGPNTLTQYGGQVTFSVVVPSATPTITATTTITSGVSDIAPTSTITVPQTTVYVTVYGTTIVSTSTSLATTSTGSVLTVTGTCPPKSSATLTKCIADNCLRNLKDPRYISSASAFCSTYTRSVNTNPSAIPTILKNCVNNVSRVSSACSCLVMPTAVTARGVVQNAFLPPDFTYNGAAIAPTTVTQTSGPVPSSTITEPNPTISAGTSSITSSIASTVTVTIFQSTQISVSVSTTTVAPTNCA